MNWDNLHTDPCPEALIPASVPAGTLDCAIPGNTTTTPPDERCPAGTYYNADHKRCEEIPVDGCPEPTTKPAGHHWDPITCQWVKDAEPPPIEECPDGMSLVNGVCVDDPPVLTQRLEIRPGFAVMKPFQSIQFKVFLVDSAGNEEELSADLIFSIDNPTFGMIGGASGQFTALDTEGIATITAQSTAYDLTPVMAQVQIVQACAEQKVGIVILVDDSKTMGQAFGTVTKLQAAKSIAVDFVQKMTPASGPLPARFWMGIVGFNATAPAIPMTVPAITLGYLAAAPSIINAIPPTTNKTNISNAIAAGISRLNAIASVNRRLIVVLTDGEQTLPSTGAPAITAFKEEGGVIMVIGIRACDRTENKAFSYLQQLATPGFFLNTFPPDTTGNIHSIGQTKDQASRLKSLVCAGDCNPNGGAVYLPALNYTGFKQWDVKYGHVDLIGDGGVAIFDLLPGHGLYVDMIGSAPGWFGTMRLKTPLTCKADNTGNLKKNTTYRIKFKVAGNQRLDTGTSLWKMEGRYATSYTTTVSAISVGMEVTVTNWLQPFTEYSFDITTPANPTETVYYWLEFAMTQQPDVEGVASYGLLLDDVEMVEMVGDTEGESVFSDDFNTENLVVLPACPGVTPWSYGYGGYGYGGYTNTDPCTHTGCATEPPPEQTPDPNPLPLDTES